MRESKREGEKACVCEREREGEKVRKNEPEKMR